MDKIEITREKWTEIYEVICYKHSRGESVNLPYALVPVGKDKKYYILDLEKRERNERTSGKTY